MVRKVILIVVLALFVGACGDPHSPEKIAEEKVESMEERSKGRSVLIISMYRDVGRERVEKFLNDHPEWSIQRMSGGDYSTCYAVLVKDSPDVK